MLGTISHLVHEPETFQLTENVHVWSRLWKESLKCLKTEGYKQSRFSLTQQTVGFEVGKRNGRGKKQELTRFVVVPPHWM